MNRPPEFVRITPTMLRPRLPRVGNIKTGGRGKKMGSDDAPWYQPVKFDHFRVTKRARDASGNFVLDEVVHTHRGVGPKPRELDVVLMFNEPEHNWQASFVAYDGKKLRCQGNGETAFDRVLGKEIPCTCPLLKQHEGPYEGPQRPGKVACKPYGVLSVLLPHSNTYGGFYVYRTTSWETISSITASLELFYRQFGGLAFLPLKLVLNPVLDSYEEKGKTKSSTTWKPSLVLAGSIDTAFQIASGAQDHRAKLLQLSAGTVYTPEEHVEQLREIAREDEGDVADEYFPPSEAEKIAEADYEIEEEPDPLEVLIRRACKIAGASDTKVNQGIESNRDNLVEYAERVQEQLAERSPEAWEKAKAEIEAEATAAESADHEVVETGASREPATSAPSLNLFD